MANNVPIVTVSEFTEIVKQQFVDGDFRPLFGLGKGGIGKTESIETLTKELEIGYVDIRLLLYSETDLKGIPFPNAEHTKAVWLQNDILPDEERDGKKGILVLDEITSCSRSLRTAAYQLLNERRLGQYELPAEWLVVCLGNGEEDGGDFEGMEANFVNRCSMFNVMPDDKAWRTWAVRNGVNPLVTAYVQWKPSDLHTYKDSGDYDCMLFASPRSWVAVSNILNHHGDSIESRIVSSRILGNLGNEVGNRFLAFAKYKDKTVPPEEILNGNVKAIEMLNNNIENSTGNEIIFMTVNEVVKKLADEISAEAKNPANRRGREILFSDGLIVHAANGIRWFLTLKRLETRVMALNQFFDSCKEARSLMLNRKFLMACPEIRQFAANNSTILLNQSTL